MAIYPVMFGLPDITLITVGGTLLVIIIALIIWALRWREVRT
ncbi:hypothetical protein ASZ90_014842 [hydrocarbon metagenome]|uniref:Uncharacterized protein n=1 Tax=hydrocarbon metagenome TaxID=938273 RepID=A0A0W8F421_9ZZZZ